MSRRVNLIGIFSITLSFFVLLFFATKNSNYYEDYKKETKDRNRGYYYFSDTQQASKLQVNLTATIHDVLTFQRQQIAEEMQYYEFPSGKFGVEAKNLQELVPEMGGTPMRSIIFTSWRSGSTFFGDLLNALPGNFYHYEPLMAYEIMQIRGAPHAKPAINLLKRLLRCEFSALKEYLDYVQSHTYVFMHNSRLWDKCQLFPHFCYSAKFVEPFCKLFPLQSMKVVRLRAKLAEHLLDDTSLNVRIVLLIRDPRGALQSRKHRDWCPGNPDCDNPNIVCKDMVSDYNAAVKLAKKYPMTFKVVRYEDLSLAPYDVSQEILQFYGLDFDERVSEFLESHTKKNVGGVSSTFRNSKSTPFHWTKELSFKETEYIQDSCKEAMRLWGYKEASNASELKENFNPLLPFPDFDIA